jgi:hypothetical protein
MVRLEATESSVYLRYMQQATIQIASCFRFLRKLRADGRTNMYGAVPYLMKTFNLDRESAFAIVCQWLDQQAHAEPALTAAPRKVRRRAS